MQIRDLPYNASPALKWGSEEGSEYSGSQQKRDFISASSYIPTACIHENPRKDAVGTAANLSNPIEDI